MKNKQTDHIPDISKMVSTEDVSTEFVEIVNKNFWEMIDMKNKQTERVAEGGKTMRSIDWLEDQFKRQRLVEIIDFQQAKQMEKEHIKQELIGLLNWMNKVAKTNPMAFETDAEDIVEMYLNGYYITKQ